MITHLHLGHCDHFDQALFLYPFSYFPICRTIFSLDVSHQNFVYICFPDAHYMWSSSHHFWLRPRCLIISDVRVQHIKLPITWSSPSYFLQLNIFSALIVSSESPSVYVDVRKGKRKAISVTSHEGPQGCVTSRLPHFLDNRLTDCGEVVSLTRQPPFTPGRFLVLISVRGWVDPRAIVRLED
jgi:hypothetical protein